ncbi:hypothetical protein WG904_07120 [Pedobacter sp. Du54]|uniref:hypothetical protein n=1 Tax=Pedobacter anseongensis TaxID=3133439 RepID=UPI003094C99A
MSIKKTKTALLSIITLLTILVFVQACEKSDARSLTGTILLTDKETKTVVHQGKTIAITASDFKDSRCPINADCIWQGNASVKIKFKDDVKEQEITMCLGACDVLSVPLPKTIQLNGTTYKIKLEEITPYPTLDKNKPEVSKAKLTFSE